MSTPIVPSVIAGLAVGAALIIVFSLFFQGPSVSLVSTSEKFFVTIPLGASEENRNFTFKPEKTRMILYESDTCCAVVKWVNQDTVPAPLHANDETDPDFYALTKNMLIEPEESFEFSFTKPGSYGFYGRPWQQGMIEVFPCNCD